MHTRMFFILSLELISGPNTANLPYNLGIAAGSDTDNLGLHI